MEKELLVLSEWKDKSSFHQLKKDIEENILHKGQVDYLFCIRKAKEVEELPKVPHVFYLSKKDFNLFGKLKNTQKRELLHNNSKVLIAALDKNSNLIKKTIKNANLLSIGIHNENLPTFDMAFRNTQLENGKFFKQINNYLKKIQL